MVEQTGNEQSSQDKGSLQITRSFLFFGEVMKKTAILVDGGFYRKVANHLFGEKSPEERADELIKYCHFHLKDRDSYKKIDNKKRYNYSELYCIFYYDCEPIRKTILSFNTIHTLCRFTKKINIKSVLQTSYKACQRIAESVLS